MITLNEVPKEYIDFAWRKGASNLARALKNSVECTADQLKARLFRGEIILLSINDNDIANGWFAVQFIQNENSRCLYVHAVYAPKVFDDAFAALCQYALANGASYIDGSCSKASARLFQKKKGFKEVYRTIRYCLLEVKNG